MPAPSIDTILDGLKNGRLSKPSDILVGQTMENAINDEYTIKYNIDGMEYEHTIKTMPEYRQSSPSIRGFVDAEVSRMLGLHKKSDKKQWYVSNTASTNKTFDY